MKVLSWVLPLAVVVLATIVFFRDFRSDRLDPKMRAEIEKSEAARSAILFIGSSTIDRFRLAEAFPGRNCVNLGRGNENALQLRERLKTDLPQIPPAGIVLYAGSADLRFEPVLTPLAIRERVAGVLGDLRARYPLAPIAMLQVLPARDQSSDERLALEAVNLALSLLAKDRGVVFVRTNRAPLTDRDGDLAESMSTDRHHLNADGYRVLAKWIIDDGGVVGARLR
jgi:lysophospholipase L1-like esterase